MTSNEYKDGYYTVNNVLYKLNGGYKVYNGSDNAVYFSNDETNYTKLTEMSVLTAMQPVTASVTGTSSEIQVSGNTDLTATLNNATIKTVAWQSDKPGVASVTGDTATATVSGVAEGTATITATITYDIGANSDDKTIAVTYPVKVVAAPAQEG